MYDPDAKNATPQEIAEAAVTGAIAAGVLEGGIELPTAVGNTVSRVRTVRNSVGTNQDIVARVYDEKAGDGNTLYYFIPEKIITTKKVDAGLPTGTLHERTMIQEAAPTSYIYYPTEPVVWQPVAGHEGGHGRRDGRAFHVRYPDAERDK
ncbi:hypothetical protein I4200191B4_12010 [Pseudoflavonifractor gallinarum]|uniref:hypothetical protein n=1 Tax=Eubacteriales TaxID=186802 RepID=UPI00189869AB|nr:hypothetical protein [Clostridium sp. J1101437_171009_A5]